MKHFKLFAFLLVIFAQQISIKCATPAGFEELGATAITLSSLTAATTKKYYFDFNGIDFTTSKILHITSTTDKLSYPGYLYASFNDAITEGDRLFSSQNSGTNELYIDLSQHSTEAGLRIILSVPKVNSNTITLKAELMTQITLTGNNQKARLNLYANIDVLYTVPNPITYNKILIYSLGETRDYFDMEIAYGTDSTITPEKNFENGYGAIVNLNTVGQGTTITIKLKPKSGHEKTKVEVGFEMIDQETTYKRKVNLLEHVYGATDAKQTCYEMTENIELSKHPILLINAFSQAVSFVVYETGQIEKVYSQDGFHTIIEEIK